MSEKETPRLLPRLLPDRLPFHLRSSWPGVTIVIPNWNHEYVLPRSVRSALAAVKNLRDNNIAAEVLVIDDASQDGSLTLLRQLEALYFDAGLRVLALPQNVGVVAVRNIALTHTNYRTILFMDADNELIPENTYLFYRAMLNTEAAVVYGNLIHHGPGSQFLDLFSNESFQPHMFRQNYIDTFALYDKLQIFDVGGFEENLTMHGHEDWGLFLHLAASGRKLVFVPVLFGIYYDLPESRVKDVKSDEHKKERGAYLERVYDQLGIRQHLTPRTQHLRYHPDVGYI